ncbi:hypothetical protein TI39_contig374g00007 [Zymoseptoria brevis]|uniref:Uncharacterized protein n=1 Tax=Zymoseptoria brevis TaxID=1047168 RepID=A0A0F4GPE1_9PEZI|nr:hypothetical protein TI39_contig374g00007 [Zymoseptoria brevis]
MSICPVVGTTTNVLPPHHPAVSSDPEAVCPVTNAKVKDHNTIVNHPSAPHIPSDDSSAMDASSCPALKNANAGESVTDATCPVVGPVNAHLPPSHPALNEKDSGAVCPVTNAKLEHHKGKVANHPTVANDAAAKQCPVVGASA